MEKESLGCASCLHNEFNICKSMNGYYFYGEVISDENVACEDFEQNSYAYQVLLKKSK